LGLVDDRFVPVKPEPFQPLNDVSLKLGLASFPIGVFNSEQELATMLSGEKPIEKRCPSRPNMKVTGWRRGNPNANFAHFHFTFLKAN
jgi:hypothetical protein